MTDITLSLVVYNDYERPLALIESLENHLPENLEIELMIVDNSTIEFIQKRFAAFKAKLDNRHYIKYINPGRNLGFGKAHNLALSRSSAQYFLIINPDILFVEDSLSLLKTFMDSHEDLGMCIPRIVDKNGSLQHVYRKEVTVLDAVNRTLFRNRLRSRANSHTLKDADYSVVFELEFGQGSFLFCRTDILRSVNGFDDRYFMYLEDADLCKKMRQVSKFEYCPDTTVIHLWEKGSHKDATLLRYHMSSYLKYFNKWGWKFV